MLAVKVSPCQSIPSTLTPNYPEMGTIEESEMYQTIREEYREHLKVKYDVDLDAVDKKWKAIDDQRDVLIEVLGGEPRTPEPEAPEMKDASNDLLPPSATLKPFTIEDLKEMQARQFLAHRTTPLVEHVRQERGYKQMIKEAEHALKPTNANEGHKSKGGKGSKGKKKAKGKQGEHQQQQQHPQQHVAAPGGGKAGAAKAKAEKSASPPSLQDPPHAPTKIHIKQRVAPSTQQAAQQPPQPQAQQAHAPKKAEDAKPKVQLMKREERDAKHTPPTGPSTPNTPATVKEKVKHFILKKEQALNAQALTAAADRGAAKEQAKRTFHSAAAGTSKKDDTKK